MFDGERTEMLVLSLKIAETNTAKPREGRFGEATVKDGMSLWNVIFMRNLLLCKIL